MTPNGEEWMLKQVQHDGHDTTNFSSTILDRTLQNPLGFHLLDLGDRLGGVQSLGADVCAIHDRVAAIEAERIFEIVEPLAGHLVAAVGEPAIRLEQDRRSEEHTSELQSLLRTSYAVFCLKK